MLEGFAARDCIGSQSQKVVAVVDVVDVVAVAVVAADVVAVVVFPVRSCCKWHIWWFVAVVSRLVAAIDYH